MKTIKSLLFVLMLTFSTSNFAATAVNKDPLSRELASLLSNSGLIINKEFTVKVFFTVNDQKKIEIRSIDSPNEAVNQFLHNRLQGQQLKGNSWFTEKLYELPVKVRAQR